MQLAPGLLALVRLLARLLIALVTVHISHHIIEALVGETVPQWARVPAYILAFPAAVAANILSTRVRACREAARRGAVLPPRIQYKWPGALDKLLRFSRGFANSYQAEYIASECEENGNTVDFYMLYESRIFTIEPEYVKAILVTQFRSYEKGEAMHEGLSDALNEFGVFNSDGDIWKFHRTMTRPFFTKDRISDFDIFEKHAEDAIHQMKIRMCDGYPVDFQDLASRFTLDSAAEFLLGKDVCSLSAGIVYPPASPLSKDPVFLNHPSNRLFRAFMDSQIATARRTYLGSSWRFAELWQDQVQKHTQVFHEFIEPIIADMLAKKHEQRHLGDDSKDGAGEVKKGETLLEHWVNYTEDQTLLRDGMLNIIIAGRDTTAATLTFAVYMLSQHPDILARLREEIIAKVGVDRRPTHRDMQDMKYLKAFINEVLRLYPPLPSDVRLSTEGQIWPAVNGGKAFYVPPNTMTIYSIFLIHRRKDLWGPDADLFDPDRFLDARLHKYLTPKPCIFLPFNAGPRICLGQQFAYYEVSYFLVRLLQSIDGVALDMEVQQRPPAEWSQAKGRKALEKVMLQSHLTMYVEGGLWVRMKEADPVDSV